MAKEADAESLTPEKAVEKRSEQVGHGDDENIIEKIDAALDGSLLGKLQSTDEETKAEAEKEKSQVEDKADEAEDEIEDNKDDAPEDAGPPPKLEEPSDKPEVKDHGDEDDDDGDEREEAEEGKGEAKDEKDAGPGKKEGAKQEGAKGGAQGGGLLAPSAASDGEIGAMLDDFEPKSTATTDTLSRIGEMAEIANSFRGELDDYVASGDGLSATFKEAAVNRVGATKEINALFHDNPYKDVEGGLGKLAQVLHYVKSIAQLVGKVSSTLGMVLTIIGLLGMIFAPIGAPIMKFGKLLNTIGIISHGVAALMSYFLVAINGVVLAKQIQEGGSAEEKAATADLMVAEASESAGSLMSAGMAFGANYKMPFLAKSKGVVAALFKKTKAKVGGFIAPKVQKVKTWGKAMLRKLRQKANSAGTRLAQSGAGTTAARLGRGVADKAKRAGTAAADVGRGVADRAKRTGTWAADSRVGQWVGSGAKNVKSRYNALPEKQRNWLKEKAFDRSGDAAERILRVDPTSPGKLHDADEIQAEHISEGTEHQVAQRRRQGAEIHEEVTASESAASEPAEDAGEDEGALPYWPSLVGDSGEFQQASDDLGDMRKVAEEFRSAQFQAKEKAYEALVLYEDYDEYAKKRKEQAKEHKAKTAETAAETEQSCEAAGEGEKLGAQAVSEQNEAKSQGAPESPDIPEPEGKGFFGRILAKFQKWAKRQAGKIFGWIQGLISDLILRAISGVSMSELQEYSADLRERQASAGEVAESGEEQSELAEKSNVELSETAHVESHKAVEAIAECDHNIEEADQFLKTIDELEEQLAEEQETADTFIETVIAEVEAERAEAEAEEAGDVLEDGGAGGEAPMSMAPEAMMSVPEDAPEEDSAGDDFAAADMLITTEAAVVKRQAQDSLRELEQDRDRHEQHIRASESAGAAVVEEFRPHAEAIMAEMDAVAATAATPDTLESLIGRIIGAEAELAERRQAACEALEKAFEEAYAQADEPMTPAPRPAGAGPGEPGDSALDAPMTPAGGARESPAQSSEPAEALS